MSGLDAAALRAALRTHALGRPLHVLPEVGSTNDVALDLLARGAPHGTLVVADRQTAGRGQRGRAWQSAAGLGLYASLVLRGTRRLDTPTLVVAAVGLGLAEGLEAATGVHAEIKWPNDLWHRGRKLAGILVEARGFRPEEPAFVAGFGVNVLHGEGDFPPELRDAATSLALAARRTFDRVAVLADALLALEPRIEEALSGGAPDLERAYRDRSLLRGRAVELLHGDRPLRGVVVEVGARDGLIVRRTDGTHVHVRAEHAREVRTLPEGVAP